MKWKLSDIWNIGLFFFIFSTFHKILTSHENRKSFEIGPNHKVSCFNLQFSFKIGQNGISLYLSNSIDDIELDLTRWTAPEAYKSGSNYVWKCDIWSLAVVYWECLTLGATPYHEVPNKEVPFRVMRGVRLKQPDYISGKTNFSVVTI